jgi:hypothetical protein
MSDIKNRQNIDELRKRLYDRGLDGSLMPDRHKLTRVNSDISRGWGVVPSDSDSNDPVLDKIIENEIANKPSEEARAFSDLTPMEDKAEEVEVAEEEVIKKTSRSYRKIILLGSIGLFILVALVSSVYLFFGNNQISAKNISIDVNVPFTLAAGEKMPIQISISNQNSVHHIRVIIA